MFYNTFAKLFLLLKLKTSAKKLLTTLNHFFYSLYISNTFGSDPIWSEWEKGVCSKACLGGSRTDKRVCIHGNCEGASEVTLDCNDRTCKGIHTCIYNLETLMNYSFSNTFKMKKCF